MRVGIVGVGAIAVNLVDAILTGPRAGDVEVVVSPRSRARSDDLASRYDRVRIAADNQAVVDASDIVVLSVLPGQMGGVCSALTFREDQVIASLAAGWPPSHLREVMAPATRVAQLIPMPMIALHVGPIVMSPSYPELVELLEGCGHLVVPDREQDIIVLSCASATMSSFFAFQNTVVEWAASVGFPASLAHEYVSALFAGLAAESETVSVEHLAALPGERETPGGLNEQVRRALTDVGTFDELTRTMAAMHRDRVQSPIA